MSLICCKKEIHNSAGSSWFIQYCKQENFRGRNFSSCSFHSFIVIFIECFDEVSMYAYLLILSTGKEGAREAMAPLKFQSYT